MRKLKITELNRLTVDEFKQANKLPLAVILDEVRSLHNIGSVFRTSDAFLQQFVNRKDKDCIIPPLLPILKCTKRH